MPEICCPIAYLFARLRLASYRVLSLASLIALTGCEGTILDMLPPSPFAREERTSYRTPSQRIAALEDLTMSPVDSPAAQEEIVKRLAEMIRDEDDPLIRRRILETIAKYPSPASDALLKVALQDQSPRVRERACELIGNRGGSAAARTLAEALASDTDVDVRLAAARELSRFKDQESIAAMQPALEDNDPALQYRAMLSLKDMTGKDYGSDVSAWRQFVQTGEPPKKKEESFVQRLFEPLWR